MKRINNMKRIASASSLALAIAAFGVIASVSAASAGPDSGAIEVRLRQLESEIAKLRKEARDAKAQAQSAAAAAQKSNVSNAAHVKAGDVHAPPPVFVSFKNGLFVETEDKAYSFKVGGRLQIDGGGNTEPLNGWAGQTGFRRSRIEVEGRAAKYWFYKAQADFNGAPNGLTLGVWRDAYLGFEHPALTLPGVKDPIFIMIGSQYEPFNLEAINSSKYTDFIERAMMADTFGPYRHVGASIGAHGDNWTAKGGVYSTSFEDAALNPTPNVPAAWGVLSGAGWVPTGGAQYYDFTGRLTYAPIKDEHNLLHLGIAGRYHRPNDATGASDDRELRLGNRVRSEANILNQSLLGTPDLSCGSVSVPYGVGAPFIRTGVAGHCVRDIFTFGVELAGSYGPFSIQAEYNGAQVNRNMTNVMLARMANVFAPGGSSEYFSGWYVQGQYWLTGEERVSAYSVKDRNGATFEQIKIKNPLSAGGWGAWGLAARYSEVNLNSGGLQGSSLYNALALTTFVAPNPAATALVATSGINGGRQENVTVGLNWYPDNGFHFQANWTHVLNVAAPLNGNASQGGFINGAHPNLFEARAQVYW
ncbi:carbohydrate porin [Methylocystis sp. WRRC1]|uniref:OprO/OprP family phosphate-selective porin n=1 Tax=Methylocystis sp. WRRC1 TaxID=1732014 RepID=UPI001D13F7C4|nr:porin [Methylocystis sp. WRRC1]MCC3247142.1 carbohydrate porin [Methylocystis sp. WRRC1]